MRTLALIAVLFTLVMPGLASASKTLKSPGTIHDVDVRLDYAPDTRKATLILTNRSDRPVTLYYIDTEHSDKMLFPGRLTFRTRGHDNKILTMEAHAQGEGFVNNWGFPYEHHCGKSPFGMKPLVLQARQQSHWDWDLSDKIKEKDQNPESTVDLAKVKSIQMQLVLFANDGGKPGAGYDYTSNWFGFSDAVHPASEDGTRDTRTTARAQMQLLDPSIVRADFSFPRSWYAEPQETDQHMILHEMAASSDMNKVKELIQSGANPHQLNRSGESVLHWAVENDNLPLVQVLLEQGVDPNVKDKDGMTPLHWAAIQNNDDIIRTLLKGGANLNAEDKDQATPFHLAAWNGSAGALKVLLESATNPKDHYRFSVVHDAARTGKAEILALLFDHGYDPNQGDKRGEAPLMYSVEWGDNETSRLLLSRGGRLDAKDNNGHTLLYRAARGGNLENADFLLKNSVDPNIRSRSGDTPLHIAAQTGDLGMAKLLLQNGADPSLANAEGLTPLSWTANNKEMEALLTGSKPAPQRGETVSQLNLEPRVQQQN